MGYKYYRVGQYSTYDLWLISVHLMVIVLFAILIGDFYNILGTYFGQSGDRPLA